MGRTVVSMILLLALCSCASQQRSTVNMTDKEAFAKAQSVVLAHLKDPDSARFGQLARRTLHGGAALLLIGTYIDERGNDVVCGTVNAKNSYGGYTGPKVFAYQTEYDKLYMDDERSRVGSMWCVDSGTSRHD